MVHVFHKSLHTNSNLFLTNESISLIIVSIIVQIKHMNIQTIYQIPMFKTRTLTFKTISR